MRRYETIFIVGETLADEQVREITERLQGVIAKQGGKVVRTDNWGRRTLAYELGKSRRGNYVLVVWVGAPEAVAEAERTLHFNELVLRYHTVKAADDVDIAAAQPEESQPAPADIFGERALPRREFTEGAESEEAAEEPIA